MPPTHYRLTLTLCSQTLRIAVCTLLLLTAACFAALLSSAQVPMSHSRPLQIQWVDSLPGDFSFRHQWSYQPGVSLQPNGRVMCDGLCPPATAAMVDQSGNIFPDSLASYYRLVDTTHLYHTLASEAHCYEWAGADYISAQRCHDTIAADTYCNPATHSSLRLRIVGDKCYARILESSIMSSRNGKRRVYYCTGGEIKIDKKLLAKGILKAGFDFSFRAPRAMRPMYWRGRIYKKLEPPQQYEGMWLN